MPKKTDVPIHTVRHYTKIGLLKPSRNSRNNYKIYQPDDVILLRFINNAKELGFTLKEISKILIEAEKGNSPCPLARKVIEKRIAENHKKIKQMQQLQTKMKKVRESWRVNTTILVGSFVESVCEMSVVPKISTGLGGENSFSAACILLLSPSISKKLFSNNYSLNLARAFADGAEF